MPIASAPAVRVRLYGEEKLSSPIVVVEIDSRFRLARFSMAPPSLIGSESPISARDSRTIVEWITDRSSILSQLSQHLADGTEHQLTLGHLGAKPMPEIYSGRLLGK